MQELPRYVIPYPPCVDRIGTHWCHPTTVYRHSVVGRDQCVPPIHRTKGTRIAAPVCGLVHNDKCGRFSYKQGSFFAKSHKISLYPLTISLFSFAQ